MMAALYANHFSEIKSNIRKHALCQIPIVGGGKVKAALRDLGRPVSSCDLSGRANSATHAHHTVDCLCSDRAYSEHYKGSLK